MELKQYDIVLCEFYFSTLNKTKNILVTAGFIGFHLAKVANSGCETNFPRKNFFKEMMK